MIKGSKQTPEAIEKNRLKHLGKKDTTDTIEKKRTSHIGARNGFFGKKHSEETKRKMRVAKSEETCLRMSMSKKGKLPANIEILKLSRIGNPMSESHCTNHSISMRSKETRNKMSISQRGDKNPNWNDGVTPLYKRIRECSKYYDWRDAVYDRDNYCDSITGERGNHNLNAHHVIPFATLVEKYNITTLEEAIACEALWDISNGITMIEKNHIAYHARTNSPE